MPERIRYGGPSLRLDDTPWAVHANGGKQHVGRCPGSPPPEPLASEVAPYGCGRDTVRCHDAAPLPDALITRVGEALRRT